MRKLAIIIMATLSAGIYACKHAIPETTVCFQSEILPIFQTNCATAHCHDATSNVKGYTLDSYDNLKKKDGRSEADNIIVNDPEHSKLYQVLFDSGNKKMPLPPNADLTSFQKNLIAKWIREGARNTTNCKTVCDSSQFTFSANIQPLIQTHCTQCHSGPSPPNGIDLTTYTNVHVVALNGLLYGVTAQLPGYVPMPKDGSGKLSDCEIAQIRKWVQAGSLNN